MAWLSIFNWDVGAKSANEQTENIGTFGRSFDGGFVDARRASLGMHKFTSSPLVEEDARTLYNLMLGLGETWTADSASDEEYGSRGTGVASGSTWTRITSGPSPKWGAGCYDVLSGNYFEPNYTLPDEWTILAWKYESSWEAFALLDDGTYWDGTAKNSGDDPDLWIDTSTTGRPRFEGKNKAGSNANTNYDYIQILPYRASDNFIEAYNAMTDAPIGGLPFVTAGGDYFSSTSTVTKKVFGTAVKKKPLMSNVGGTFNHVGRIVDFEFSE